MNRTPLLAAALAAVVTLAACSPKGEDAAKPSAQADQAPAPAPQKDLLAGTSASPNSGKVLQIEQAGIYTYAEVDTGSQKIWVAGGQIDAKVGDTVQWGDYAVMNNFTAKSLNRTFEQVLFVNNWGPAGGAMAPMAPHGTPPAAGGMTGHPPMAGHPPMGGGQMPMAGGSVGKVKSVATAAGYSYLEVDQSGRTVWIAAPEMQVKAGDNVSWTPGATMRNFNAKSLNRVFDEIVFVGGAAVVR